MPEGRPEIPAQMKRDLLEEVGHRCAIPTCKATEILEFAHIDSWAKVKDHTFENLIVLCANDHGRFDRKIITRQSMLAYKRNLSILNGRYSDFEQRLLQVLSQGPQVILDGGSMTFINTMNLVNDGLVLRKQTWTSIVNKSVLMDAHGTPITSRVPPGPVIYELSAKGRIFLDKWFGAQEIE